MKKFKLNTEIYYEINSIEKLKDIKRKRAYIVTDELMVELGNIAKITYILDDNNIDWCLFDKVVPDPTVDVIKKGLHEMIDFKPDTIIAIGGGSSIDTAKGILYFYMKILEKLIDKNSIKKPLFIAIPTTSGTGSEVTSYSVITDGENNVKIPIISDDMVPDIAIIDCNFTKTVPPSVTADTGLDVLTHAIEAYVARGASGYTDIYAEKAIKHVFSYLLKAYSDGNNIESREKMHDASCMAGIAFTNAGLGINHSLAHALGAKFHIPHGKANAILLPYIIEYNSGISEDRELGIAKRYCEISKILGFPSSTTNEGVLSLIEGIKILKEKMDVPNTLSEMGIKEDDFRQAIDEIVEKAMNDACTSSNPRDVKEEDLKVILNKAYGN
ncbi:iron-containing alcohol dehydrogenase [Anaerosalibacter bizertensis]|uniref:Iron-containing alcohol dehydrogenase n=1 Tax=Anaerosalibacter bizertensis TaxID=932217 RepID=A0A844FJN3_9FIRM|nr:1-propanol dehydrogenase PduQ [Anaerosalibacter bizertensis]MSS44343.1 iron-containing alcohol dehydrogenase [Anaerosalibacter bizertensis]HHV26689.1 iron-containing alcohol dehydrogenase [Tissierellia bacterium]